MTLHTLHKWAYCLILQKSRCAAQHTHVQVKHMHTATSAKRTGLMVHEKLMCTWTQRPEHVGCIVLVSQTQVSYVWGRCSKPMSTIRIQTIHWHPAKTCRIKTQKGGQLKTFLLPALWSTTTSSSLLKNSSHSNKFCSGRGNIGFLCLPPHSRNTWYPCNDNAKCSVWGSLGGSQP